jgi:ribonuclease HII
MQFLVGVDEVGRGPIAGPVAVGVVAVPIGFDWSRIPDIKDSKKMTEKAREKVYEQTRDHGVLFTVQYSTSELIDDIGIVSAITRALERGLEALHIEPALCEVRLDGGLAAPAAYTRQTTIIRGDASEPVIGLASIVAKVERDRLMVEMSKQYPHYGFEKHKGYGTKLHYDALKRHGLTVMHRRSFIHLTEK